MSTKQWDMQIVDGDYNGTNYKYAPFIQIFNKDESGEDCHVAQVRLVGTGYGHPESIDDERKANARLITAAPELYMLMREQLHFAEVVQRGLEPTPWLVKARALKAKIEGLETVGN